MKKFTLIITILIFIATLGVAQKATVKDSTNVISKDVNSDVNKSTPQDTPNNKNNNTDTDANKEPGNNTPNKIGNKKPANIILQDVCDKESVTLYWDELTSCGRLERGDNCVTFIVDNDIIIFGDDNIESVDPPVIIDSKLTITPNFWDRVLEHLKKPSPHANGFKIGVILIDPGHGGKDPGAFGTFKINGKQTKVQEKTVVLTISKYLRDNLKKAYPGKNIILTRSSDKFLTLDERTVIANGVKLSDNEAVLYVSIHANASLDKKAAGYEAWYLSPGYRRTVLNKDAAKSDDNLFPILNSMMEEEYTTESILMSKFIMDGLSGTIGNLSKARGIKAEEWFVVKNANMPSALVEVGFVTNEREATLLNTDSYLQKIAKGIGNGITAFVTHFEKSRGFTQ